MHYCCRSYPPLSLSFSLSLSLYISIRSCPPPLPQFLTTPRSNFEATFSVLPPSFLPAMNQFRIAHRCCSATSNRVPCKPSTNPFPLHYRAIHSLSICLPVTLMYVPSVSNHLLLGRLYAPYALKASSACTASRPADPMFFNGSPTCNNNAW
jgi:hypothetical protein